MSASPESMTTAEPDPNLTEGGLANTDTNRKRKAIDEESQHDGGSEQVDLSGMEVQFTTVQDKGWMTKYESRQFGPEGEYTLIHTDVMGC